MQEQPGQRFRGVKLRSAQGVGSRVQEGPGVPFKLHSDVSLLDAPGGCLNGECRPPSSCADETGVLVLGEAPPLCSSVVTVPSLRRPAGAVTGSLSAWT